MAKGQRELAESCVDYLTLELVHHYRTQLEGPSLQVGVVRALCLHTHPACLPHPPAATSWLPGAIGGKRRCARRCQRPPARRRSPSPPPSQPQAALDAIGERVGRQLVERYARERAPLLEQLDVMKFICKARAERRR